MTVAPRFPVSPGHWFRTCSRSRNRKLRYCSGQRHYWDSAAVLFRSRGRELFLRTDPWQWALSDYRSESLTYRGKRFLLIIQAMLEDTAFGTENLLQLSDRHILYSDFLL